MNGQCKSCHQPIRWVRLEPGLKPHPLNPEPTKRGSIVLLDRNRARATSKRERTQLAKQGDALYLSHFATCPGAAQHRRRSRP